MFHTRTSAHWNTMELGGTWWNLVEHIVSVLASVPPLHVHEFTLNLLASELQLACSSGVHLHFISSFQLTGEHTLVLFHITHQITRF